MDIAPVTPIPGPSAVAHDRDRLRYAVLGALALLAGIWVAWFAAWGLGWSLDDLGIRPRSLHGLIGILTAPFAHASFEHLMSNTLPLALLTTLTLYVYPLATRPALPLIWLASGLGVWLFARPDVHVGASGIASGLMFFLFFMGLIRRDRLAVVTSLVVFFLYGGMVAGVLPHDAHVSYEYHFFGALAGLAAALAFHRRDPEPPRKRYSWEDEDEDFAAIDDELEPPRPVEVPALWDGPGRAHETAPVVIEFPGRRVAEPPERKPGAPPA
ncbi:MAG TPA: rhomboid family intramembrane serine protease [Rhodanobacteraceae bacterium]|nr:rhomboid family intramembrane serine protease [Rhodanobacteraceae bacterium]